MNDKIENKEILRNEIVNALERVSIALSEKEITVKEIYLSLPVLIATIFEDKGITKNFEEQEKFYKELKDVVNSLLDGD